MRRRSGSNIATSFLALGLASTGCIRPHEREPDNQARVRRDVIGRSVNDRPIESFTFGDRGDTTLIIASIHGNEPAGTPLLEKLVEHLRQNAALVDGRRVVLIPVANPDGLAAAQRHNARGIDLNRNFPAKNYRTANSHGSTPLSEPESRALHRLLHSCRPGRIISIHQPFTLPACIDFDGPGDALARCLSRHCELPVKKLGSRPGSLGAYAGETLGIPIITLEIPRTHDDHDGDALWNRYGEMLLAAIRFDGPGLAAK